MSRAAELAEVDAAIQRWMDALHPGVLATEWVLISAGVSSERPGTGYEVAASSALPYHNATGLVALLTTEIEAIYDEEDPQ
ncbi:hypothetical protein ACFWVM_29390 [Nocardia fluminea]|uniref:hypothetical protein n=1 Tax=Nocardia fluminea TaxID=134984 RepID=UPI003650ED86